MFRRKRKGVGGLAPNVERELNVQLLKLIRKFPRGIRVFAWESLVPLTLAGMLCDLADPQVSKGTKVYIGLTRPSEDDLAVIRACFKDLHSRRHKKRAQDVVHQLLSKAIKDKYLAIVEDVDYAWLNGRKVRGHRVVCVRLPPDADRPPTFV